MNILIITGAIIAFLCLIANLVFFIIVLVKLFKKEGVLLGILGLIFGIVTYVWGWIKHKELQLTKIMIIWTISSILPFILAIGMPFMFPGVDIKKKLTSRPLPVVPGSPAQQRIVKKSLPQQKTSEIEKPPPEKPAPVKTVEYDVEIKKLDEMIKKDSNNTRALYNRGWMYAAKGEVLKAIEDYSQVIEMDKEFGDAYFNRGLLYAKMDRKEQAIRDFSKAIEYDAQAFDAYCNRGNIYYEMGKPDLAIKDYTEALRIKPNDAEVSHNRSVVYKSIGKQAEAAADSKNAVRLMKESGIQPPKEAEEGPTKKETSLKTSAVTWKQDLKNVGIPEGPTRGMINGEVFMAESAKLENGILTLRDGKEFLPDHAVTVFLFLKGESPDGKIYDIASSSGFGSPHVHMKWMPKNSKTPKSRVFMKGYSMRLEFGKTQGGKLDGKIYLCLPDEMRSYLAGSFTASVAEKEEAKRPAPRE